MNTTTLEYNKLSLDSDFLGVEEGPGELFSGDTTVSVGVKDREDMAEIEQVDVVKVKVTDHSGKLIEFDQVIEVLVIASEDIIDNIKDSYLFTPSLNSFHRRILYNN